MMADSQDQSSDKQKDGPELPDNFQFFEGPKVGKPSMDPISMPSKVNVAGYRYFMNSIFLFRLFLSFFLAFMIASFLVLYRVREAIPDAPYPSYNWNYVAVVLTPLTVLLVGKIFHSYTSWELIREENERERHMLVNMMCLAAVVIASVIYSNFKQDQEKASMQLATRRYFVGSRLIIYLFIGVLSIAAAKSTKKLLFHGFPKLKKRLRVPMRAWS